MTIPLSHLTNQPDRTSQRRVIPSLHPRINLTYYLPYAMLCSWFSTTQAYRSLSAAPSSLTLAIEATSATVDHPGFKPHRDIG
jgi:hypothetical protein